MRVKRARRTPEVHPSNSSSSSPATKVLGLGVAALAAVPAANAATFTVTNLNDSGAGSLRQAIADANSAATDDVVDFQAGLTGTITLTTGEIAITDDVDIDGPGAATITVSGNNASRVFYLYNPPELINVRIAGLTITQGSDSYGGGIMNVDENLTIEDAVITGNHANGDGGGLWSDGFSHTLTIRNSTLSGNTSGGDGGAIYVEDTGNTLTIEGSRITGNTAGDQGGGIYLYDPDHNIDILSTTISGNTAAVTGGGIYLYNGYYTMSANFVTIANNSAASEGGGIFMMSAPVDITNSIVGDNTAPANADLSTGPEGEFDVAYSLVEAPGTATITDNGGNINVDPQLDPLANYGGPTETHRPGVNSPVINAADPTFVPPPGTDQRGFARVVAGRADMGSVEINGGTIQINPTAYNVNETDGSVNVTVTRDTGQDPASVSFGTGDVSATAGSDYTTTNVTVNFAAGDLSEDVTIPILNDAVAETPETFTGTITTPSAGAVLGANTAGTVTINDSPSGTLQFSVASASTPEEAGTVTLTVTRVGGTEGALSANYATANGTAMAGSDYTAAAGVVNFADGDSTPKNIVITILDEGEVEPNETFTVTLSGPAVGSPATEQITINNIDAVATPIPTLGLFGRLMLGMMSTLAAMWALMRRGGASMFFLGVLLIGVLAATPASAANGNAMKKHDAAKLAEKKGVEKVRGTIQSITSEGGKLTITLSNGKSVTVPAKTAQITDFRDNRRQDGEVADLVAGRNVVVKVKANGTVKIRIIN